MRGAGARKWHLPTELEEDSHGCAEGCAYQGEDRSAVDDHVRSLVLVVLGDDHGEEEDQRAYQGTRADGRPPHSSSAGATSLMVMRSSMYLTGLRVR